VLMANGSFMPIEHIAKGDFVACDFDPKADNGPEQCRVVDTFVNTVVDVLDLTVTTGDVQTLISTTPEHPFYVPAMKAYVAAADLNSGTRFLTADGGTATLVSSELRPGRVRVYNFEVAGAHNYYVSHAQVLVHNVCPLGRGSTGRTVARNLREQLAMEEVLSAPGGTHLKRIDMSDKRWPKSEGWEKWQQIFEFDDGTQINIHYVKNPRTGAFDDFKFKD